MDSNPELVQFLKETLIKRLDSLEAEHRGLSSGIADLRVSQATMNGRIETQTAQLSAVKDNQNVLLLKVALPLIIGIILAAVNTFIALKSK